MSKPASGQTGSTTSAYIGRHRPETVRPVLGVRPPAEQARIIREIREGRQ